MGKQTENELSQEEANELMQALAETEARLAAGWTPTPEEVEESKIPHQPDPEELAGVLEAIDESKAARAKGTRITHEDIQQMLAEMIAEAQSVRR